MISNSVSENVLNASSKIDLLDQKEEYELST